MSLQAALIPIVVLFYSADLLALSKIYEPGTPAIVGYLSSLVPKL